MTRTAPAIFNKASVRCPVCKDTYLIDLDILRMINDSDGILPDCGCVKTKIEVEVRERCLAKSIQRRLRYTQEVEEAEAQGRRLIQNAFEVIVYAMFQDPDAVGHEAKGMHWTKIVVDSWMLDRKRFGLLHYHDRYPDSNKIRVALVNMAKSSPGYVEQPRQCHYKLTKIATIFAPKLKFPEKR